MKWILVFTILCCASVNQAIAQTEVPVIKFTDTNPREWADDSNQNRLTARLLSRNTEANKVLLECTDGTTVEVVLSDLSMSDRKYIARQTSKVKRAAHRLERQRRQGDEDLLVDASQRVQPSAKPKKNLGNTRRVSNLDWLRTPQKARAVAKAKDLPIIWFRVLGDIDGYM